MSKKKTMRGWIHAIAIVLGIGGPVGITVGTLRTGADYEMEISPKQVVEALEKVAYSSSADANEAHPYVAEDVLVNGVLAPDSKGAAGVIDEMTRGGLTAKNPPLTHGRRMTVAGNVVVVFTKLDGLSEQADWKIDTFRVYGGKVVEYWSTAPKSLITQTASR